MHLYLMDLLLYHWIQEAVQLRHGIKWFMLPQTRNCPNDETKQYTYCMNSLLLLFKSISQLNYWALLGYCYILLIKIPYYFAEQYRLCCLWYYAIIASWIKTFILVSPTTPIVWSALCTCTQFLWVLLEGQEINSGIYYSGIRTHEQSRHLYN